VALAKRWLLPLRPRAPHGALGLEPGAWSTLLCTSRWSRPRYCVTTT